jgi:hypothetical protein
MENLDIIIFTVILVILFTFFIILTLKEFNKMVNDPTDAKEIGAVLSLKRFFDKILGS